MAGDENAQAPSGRPAALHEDLLALAEFEYRTALKNCGHCQDYHATFGYARLGSVKTGMKTDVEPLSSLLAGSAKPGMRVLIAASADAGLLALTAGVLRAFKPAITVADLCSTPLAVCRFFAQSHGFEAGTLQLDVAQTPIPSRHDVILAHNVMSFIPPALHGAVLANLRNALVPGGTLILGNRVQLHLQDRNDPDAHGKHGKMIANLRAKGIALPEDEAILRGRLERLDEERYSRPPIPLDLPRMEAHFAAAGFKIRERLDAFRMAKDSAPPDRATSHFFAAQRID